MSGLRQPQNYFIDYRLCEDEEERCNFCHELILVPRGSVRQCFGGDPHQGRLYRGDNSTPHLQNHVRTYLSGDHTETVEIEYDPEKTSFRKLLEIFWKNHTSTSQRGTQYMSAIFYNNEEQRDLAEVSKAERQSQTPRPIVTVITKAKIFFDAEDYHQKYMLRHYPDIIEALDLTDEELISSSIAARLNGYLGGNGSVEQFDKECSTFGLSESHLDRVRRKIKSRY